LCAIFYEEKCNIKERKYQYYSLPKYCIWHILEPRHYATGSHYFCLDMLFLYSDAYVPAVVEKLEVTEETYDVR